MLGLERVLAEPRPAPRLRHRAAPPPGRRARRDADRADRVAREGGSERKRQRRGRRGRVRRKRSLSPRRTRPRTSSTTEEEDEPDSAVPIRARSGATASVIRRRRARRSPPPGFVEAARTLGVLILTHRRLLVSQFQRDLTDRGIRRPLLAGDRARQGAAARRQPAHDPDVRVVRTPPGHDLARGVPARHLRRGAHGARREDEHARSARSRSPSTSA